MMKAKHLLSVFAAVGAMFFCGSAEAAWPERPVTIIAQGQAGSFQDLSTRRVADMRSRELGQPFVVVNQPGAGGNVAANAFLQTKSDGYTILSTSTNVYGYNMVSMKVRYAYDDLKPANLIGTLSNVVIAAPSSGWKTVRDAYAAAKSQNRVLKAATATNQYRDIFIAVGKQEGVKINPIPQKANPAAMTAVMGGHADVSMVGTVAVEAVKAGKLAALATTGAKRLASLPDIPTLIEQGIDYDLTSGFVFSFKKDDPEEIIDAFVKACEKIKATQEYADMLKSFDMDMGPLGRDGAEQFCKEQLTTAKRIVQN